MNADGKEEVVVRGGEGLEGFVKKADSWGADSTLFQGFEPGFTLMNSDYAVAVKDGKLTVFFNSGKASPRWDVHEEVFRVLRELRVLRGLDIRSTPALCDAEGDRNLDLFIGGGHYFHNASTGGVQESSEGTCSTPQRICMRRGAELSFQVEEMGEASVTLYNVADERVACLREMPEHGRVTLRLQQPSGIYFCRLKQGNFLVNTSVLLLN